VTAGFTDAGDLAVSYLTAAIPVIISVLLVGLGIGILIRVVGILRSSI
jgi:flagellar biosynthesis protein FliQ